jgi:hypothetical protein
MDKTRKIWPKPGNFSQAEFPPAEFGKFLIFGLFFLKSATPENGNFFGGDLLRDIIFKKYLQLLKFLFILIEHAYKQFGISSL